MKKVIMLVLTFTLLLTVCGTVCAGVLYVASTQITDSSAELVSNIDRAILALNGHIIKPGEVFSFNETVGPRTAEAGYVVATNGRGVQSMGGGVSQVASTLYAALKNLNTEIQYLQKQTYDGNFTGGYVTTGSDAIVTDYQNSVDFSFISRHIDDLTVSMWRAENIIFCQLTGAPTTPTPTELPTPPAEYPTPIPTAVPTAVPMTVPTVRPTEAIENDDRPSKGDSLFVVNCREYVSLRKEASSTGKVLAKVPYGSRVIYEGKLSGNFYKVTYSDTTGWMSKSYLADSRPDDANTTITMEVVNCDSYVSLRESDSKSSERLAKVEAGEKVEYISDADNGFVKVKYDDETGYILAKYLKEVSTDDSDEPNEPDDGETKLLKIVDCEKYVSLRKSDSKSSERLAKVKLGEEVEYIDDADNDFTKVKYDGQTGYILAKYLEEVRNNDETEPEYMHVANCENYVSLRETASTSAKRLAKVELGEKVEYLSKADNGFFKVRYDDMTGYVLSKYLK